MTDSQLTQCPHCKASFKVSDEQLSAANGRVRCGACLNIFDAIAYQISPPSKTPESLISEQKSNSILDDDFSFELDEAVDLETELLDSGKVDNNNSDTDNSDTNNITEDTLFADDPEEDKLEQGYSGAAKLDDE